MSPSAYRLHLAPISRLWRVAVNIVLAIVFVPAVIDPAFGPIWRVGSVAGIALAALSLRVVLGPTVVVRDSGLTVFSWWPRRRVIPWYRIFAVDIVPGMWFLRVELNSGEQLDLPVVEHVDRLYEQIELLRSRLDV